MGGTVQNEEKKMNKTMSNIAKGVVTAFSVKAIVNFGKKTVEASANLQAMNAQFDQVFKGQENEQAIDRISKQVEDLGINSDRLTSSWNSFGGQVKGAGMESEQALEAVDKATRLAADSAAFYDRSLEDSSASLASFMKGNFAAGDAIGVFTNAKQMDARANEMYGETWANLTEAERQWLLLDTVEKTYELNGAMGQASREADSYENVMGNLKATFERLYATIGEPVLEGFLVIVQKVTKWVEDNMPNIEIVVKKVFDGIKIVWDNVLKPVLEILLQLFMQIYNFVADNWEGISNLFSVVFNAIKTVWNNVLLPVLDAILYILGIIVDFININLPIVQEVFEVSFKAIGKAVEVVTGIFWNVVDAIQTAWEWLTKWNDTDAKDKDTNIKRNVDGSHANGLDFIPWDGYVAELHQGEAVLTAQQAEQWRNSGNTSNINITGNSFVIREEADIKKISRELQKQISFKQRGTVLA